MLLLPLVQLHLLQLVELLLLLRVLLRVLLELELELRRWPCQGGAGRSWCRRSRVRGSRPELGPSSKLGLMELGQLLLELCLQLELQRRVQLQYWPCGWSLDCSAC